MVYSSSPDLRCSAPVEQDLSLECNGNLPTPDLDLLLRTLNTLFMLVILAQIPLGELLLGYSRASLPPHHPRQRLQGLPRPIFIILFGHYLIGPSNARNGVKEVGLKLGPFLGVKEDVLDFFRRRLPIVVQLAVEQVECGVLHSWNAPFMSQDRSRDDRPIRDDSAVLSSTGFEMMRVHPIPNRIEDINACADEAGLAMPASRCASFSCSWNMVESKHRTPLCTFYAVFSSPMRMVMLSPNASL